MSVGLRLHGEDTYERGPGEPEGLGANQRMSHAGGEEVELTEVEGAAETQWRLQNKRRTTASDGEAPWARAQSEREGESARLSAQLSGEGRVGLGEVQKRLGRMGAWPENAQSWAHPRWRARAVRGDGSDRRDPRVSENGRANELLR
jgi:hypothetical protein